MKRGYETSRTYSVRCRSGLPGWRTRLRNNYDSYHEYARFGALYCLPAKLEYSSLLEAWNADPVIEGSVNPSDFRRVSP